MKDSHAFAYISSMAAFLCQQQSWVVATENGMVHKAKNVYFQSFNLSLD